MTLADLADLLVGPFVEFGFMRRALAGCLALSLSAPPLGVFLMLRRMSLMSEAMSHAILPGAAAGFLVAGLSLPAMTLGGLVAGLAVALAAGLVTRSTVLKEDASLAAFYLISLAGGVFLVSLRGSQVDLLHILFGTVLALDDDALTLLGGISSLTLVALACATRIELLASMLRLVTLPLDAWAACLAAGLALAIPLQGIKALGLRGRQPANEPA